MSCTCSGCKHAENAGAAADVEDDLVLEDVLILVDSVSVRSRSDFILLRYKLDRTFAKIEHMHTNISS